MLDKNRWDELVRLGCQVLNSMNTQDVPIIRGDIMLLKQETIFENYILNGMKPVINILECVN